MKNYIAQSPVMYKPLLVKPMSVLSAISVTCHQRCLHFYGSCVAYQPKANVHGMTKRGSAIFSTRLTKRSLVKDKLTCVYLHK